MQNRRQFVESVLATGAMLGTGAFCRAQAAPLFSISLAQWSLNRRIFGGELDALEFPVFARRTFDIGAVEYVNQFFMDKARDRTWLGDLKKRCDDNGVRSLLIMCDREGNLGDPDTAARTRAVENHYKWVEAAEFLGCHSIRVNAGSAGTWEAQRGHAADGLGRLSEFAADFGLNVIVENHGGLSSNGQWLAEVIGAVGRNNCGTLPDFGNFLIAPGEEYDRYRGVEELMPFAKGVSAKSYGFDERGNEIRTDFLRMMRIVLDAGYRGHVGVEFEGRDLDEVEGIRSTQALLERVRDELHAAYTA
jgi:sugar phosphate isomerase/epimerase